MTLAQAQGTRTAQRCSHLSWTQRGHPSWTHEGTPAEPSHLVKATTRTQRQRLQAACLGLAVWKHLPGLRLLSQPLICVSQCGRLSMGLRRLHSGFIRSRRWACDAHVVRGSHAGAAGPAGDARSGRARRAEPARSHGGSTRGSSLLTRLQPPPAAESSGLKRLLEGRELCSVLEARRTGP